MIEVPPDVASTEWDTPATPRGPIPIRTEPPRNTPADAPPPPEDLASILTSPDIPVSYAVREALDGLLLQVISQLQRDLLHGTQATRSKIASQFLPRIMRTLDKEDERDDTMMEELRAEMARLNAELLTSDPKLYTPNSTQTPDSDDLPHVDEATGLTVVDRAS